ncbi:zinc finger protein 91 [Musca vetustissima]|uniref:zinc finger protein 91 n=1 Tax=Musca vetustissima TaxID=27455 RepID=UPI002AB6F4E9|nr:zinc finger protein 91 [Musca vetustissima]
MLKSIGHLPNYENVKCGEIYCVSSPPAVFNVNCILCEQKISLDKYVLHFESQHLTLAEESYSLQDLVYGSTIKPLEIVDIKLEADPTEDPINAPPPQEQTTATTTKDVSIERQGNPADSSDDEGDFDENKSLLEILNEQKVAAKKRRGGGGGARQQKKQEFKIEPETSSKLEKGLAVAIDEWSGVNNEVMNTTYSDEDFDDVDEAAADDDDDWLEQKDNGTASSEDNSNDTYIELPYPCLICRRSYRSKQSLQKHNNLVHNPNRKSKASTKKSKTKPNDSEHKCNECDKVFRSERDLGAHKFQHTGIFCDICGKQFTQVGNMRRHRIRHDGIKSHKCPECAKDFFTKKELLSHMICHTGLMPWICEICGKRCRDRGVLTAHMRRHTGERPAKCMVCHKSFFSFHDLNVHAVAHTNERPFKCDICSSSFQRKKALRIHKRIHSDDRKFACQICGKTFAQSGGLKSHMVRHDAAGIEANTTKTANDIFSPASQEKSALIITKNDERCPTTKSHSKAEEDDDNSDEDDDKDDAGESVQQDRNLNESEEFIKTDNENPLETSLEDSKNEENIENAKKAKQENDLTCRICNRKYTAIKLYNKHMFATHQIKILSRKVNYKYECDECEQRFRIERDLKAHKVKHLKLAENNPSIITMLPNSEHKEQKRGRGGGGQVVEPASKNVTNLNEEIDQQQSANDDDGDKASGEDNDPEWIDDADNAAESEKDVEEVEKSNTTAELRCNICWRTFKALKFLNKHMSLRHKIKVLSRKVNYKYKCDDCEQMFRTQRDLKGHRVREHLGISCDICGKMFAQAGNMRRHRVRHSGIKAFQCTECPKAFYTSKELKSHTICHTGILPYICEICGRRCRDGGDLSAHMRRHTGERPAKCDVCGKRFFSVHDLNTHAVMHSTERPFACEICGSRFQLKKTLRVHKLIHLPPQYSCAICDKTFVQSGHLRIHMRRHGNIKDNKTNNNNRSETGAGELYVPTVYDGPATDVVVNEKAV